MPGVNGLANLITHGMRRELAEEIQLGEEQSCELIGIINDDSNEVARVHLGLVYLLRSESEAFTVMEPDKHVAEWKSPTECAQLYPHMESWSQLVHDQIVSPVQTP